jgi:putative sigma-54 modulation protein
MKLNINFDSIDSTDAIREKIEKKAEKLKKFFDGGFDVNWTCSADKTGHHSKVHIHYKGFSVDANSTKDDLYKTLDDAVSKLEKQLAKHKDQIKDKIHRQSEVEFQDENYPENE